jgi:putative FmdB family regulatory protein
MPIYDYECANCQRRFEVVHGVHVPGPTSCPLCGGGPVRKAISAPAVHFKGSGWAKKERRAAAPSSKKDPGDTGGGSDDPTRTAAPAKSGTTATAAKSETSEASETSKTSGSSDTSTGSGDD